MKALRRLPLVLLAAATAASAQEPAAGVLLQGGREGEAGRPSFEDAGRRQERERMVREQLEARDITDAQVLAAMRRVPRHLLVPRQRRDQAYTDTPLPIGHGQTISQPYIVALMTELLELDAGDNVLEVGTGSGYQAAVLAQIVNEVITIEIIEPLAREAADRLRSLGYGNITVLHGDGYYGRPAQAPYDAIIVTAAASHVPPPLVSQLAPGGRMAIPVGRNAYTQNLLLVEKDMQGEVSTRNIAPVVFVPLTGGH